MKRSLRSLMLFAAAATAFISCSNDQTESNPESPKYSFRFTADTHEDNGTRTDFGPNYTIRWQANDQIGLYIDSYLPTVNAVANVDTDSQPVYFYAEDGVNAYQEGDTFYAYYPYSETATSNFRAVELSIPAAQTQKDIAEFNGAYNPLVGVPAQTTGSGDADAMEEIKFRQTAAMIEFTPYSSNEAYQGEKIVSIAYTNDGEDALAGSFIYDLSTVPETGEMPAIDRSTLAEVSKSITVTLADGNMSEIDGTTGKDMNPVYMSVIPGTYMGSLVITTDKATYTFQQKKELELPRAYVRRLALDLATAERTTADAPKTVEDGKYAIVACYEKERVYTALSSIPNASRLSGIEVTDAYDAENQLLHSNDATLEWTIVYTTEGYTISNGEETYLTAGDKNASTAQTPAYFNITKQENGTYRIDATTVITTNKTHGLRYNATSKYFAFYSSAATASMIADMRLVSVAKDTRTQLATPEITSVTPEGKNVKIEWNKVDGAGSYTISFEPAVIGPQTYEADATAASFTQTYEVGYDQTFKVSIVANPADPTANTASEAAVSEEVTTETDPNAGQGGSVEFDFTQMGYSNGVEVTTVKKSPITITFDKGSNSNVPKYYTSGTAVRAYGGNTITIDGANIVKVEFTLTQDLTTTNYFTANTGTIVNEPRAVTWEGNTSNAIFTIEGSSGHARIQKIVVTYGEGGGETPTPSEPSIVKVDPESLSFAAAGESKTVTVTTANADGCTIAAFADNAQFSAEVAGNRVTVTAAANESDAAITGTLTIDLMKDGVAVATETVALSQDAKSEGDKGKKITYKETFNNFTTSNSAYTNSGSYTSSDIAGLTWSYKNCALNQSSTKFILGKNNTTSELTSSSISDGISEINVSWKAAFASDILQFNVYINDTLIKTITVVAASGDTGVETISDLDIKGNAIIKITGAAKAGSKDNRPGINGIEWTNNN